MFVGVCRVVFHLSGNNSLKGKRRVVRSVIDRTRAKFNASVAEVEDNDIKKRAVIGVTVVGNKASHVDAMLNRIGSFIEGLGQAEVASLETEIITIGDEIAFGTGATLSNDAWNDDNEDKFEYETSNEDEEW